jgi:hypothetical protein
MIIARLVTELRCYLPERVGPVWARLRHLGARRARDARDDSCLPGHMRHAWVPRLRGQSGG